MFHYYKVKDKYLFSLKQYKNLQAIDKETFLQADVAYYLKALNPLYSRKTYLVNHPSLLFDNEENLGLLRDKNEDYNDLAPWLLDKIREEKLIGINTNYPNWEKALEINSKDKVDVHILALGDVGSTLAIGLRLLGGSTINKLGIYDRNENNLNRWEYELNQISSPFTSLAFPRVEKVNKEDLFNCDIFVFCASKGIPPVGSQVSDVRMAQFESNSKIIAEYASMARDVNFQGIFAVVSDPVDLLCKVAFLESNKNENNQMDFKGLASNQIIGYGLGVMNGRAEFYAKQSKETSNYITEGRAYGPHGEGLLIANSIENYNDDLSMYLTDKTINANKEVRKFGFKPYVAPSLSSGALALIATINGDYFYGSTYMGGVYMGSKCKLVHNRISLEKLKLPEELYIRLEDTYKKLGEIV